MRNNIKYITLTWKSAPRSNDNIFKFDCVTVIIKNKDTQKFLALEFIKEEFWLVWWKLEDGENKDDAIIREVEEETWYKNGEIKEVIFDKIYSRWYKVRKDIEEEALDKVYYIEVEEKNKSKAMWIDVWTEKIHWFTEKEMLEKLTLTHHIYFFKEFIKMMNKKPMKKIIKNKYWEKLEYILEWNKDSSEMIIFVHGFLADLNEWFNLFKDISEELKQNFLILRFSQSGCWNSEWKEEEYNIKKSADDLESVLEFCNKQFSNKKINIIAHSMGNYIVSLVAPKNIKNTIFTWIPKLDTKKMIEKLIYRIEKWWNKINKNWITYYKRTSWNINKIWSSLWKELERFDFVSYLNNYSKITNLTIFKPLQDDVVWDINKEKIQKLSYIEINWDHSFSKKDDRKNLIKKIKEIL